MRSNARQTSAALAAILLLGALSSARGQYVEDSIDVGSAWVGSMAYNPNVDVVYGISESGGYVFAIDCQSNIVVSQVPSPNPLNIVFNSTENKAYVTVYNSVACDSVLVVNGASHGRIRTIPVRGATDLVWDSASNRVYVSCDDQWDVKVIDCATDSVIAVIRVGDGPLKMHINTRRRKLYVQNYDGRSLSIVDMQINQVTRTLQFSAPLLSGWYSAALDKYFCGGFGWLYVVGGGADTIRSAEELPDANRLNGITGNDAGRRVYVGVDGFQHGSVVEIDAVAETVLARVEVQEDPEFVYWSESSRLLYALMYRTGVAVCRVDPLQVVRTLSVQSAPFVAAYSPPTRRLYVGHLNSRLVYVIKDSVTGLAEHDPASARPSAVLRVSGSCFRGRVSVELDVPTEADAPELAVVSSDGRVEARLSGSRDGGQVRYIWAGLNERGQRASRGVYVLIPSDSRIRAVTVVKVE